MSCWSVYWSVGLVCLAGLSVDLLVYLLVGSSVGLSVDLACLVCLVCLVGLVCLMVCLLVYLASLVCLLTSMLVGCLLVCLLVCFVCWSVGLSGLSRLSGYSSLPCWSDLSGGSVYLVGRIYWVVGLSIGRSVWFVWLVCLLVYWSTCWSVRLLVFLLIWPV